MLFFMPGADLNTDNIAEQTKIHTTIETRIPVAKSSRKRGEEVEASGDETTKVTKGSFTIPISSPQTKQQNRAQIQTSPKQRGATELSKQRSATGLSKQRGARALEIENRS